MQLIILAAGVGNRLNSVVRDYPKSLVPILEDTPYLLLQIRAFDQFHFSKKIIVGGHAFEALQSFFKEKKIDDYLLIKNHQFEKGNVVSLQTALSHLDDDFFIFNADHYYSLETYQKILLNSYNRITIFCDQDRQLTDDDMKVALRLDSKGFERMAKTLQGYDFGYVGVTCVPKHKKDLYEQACLLTQELQGDQVHVEHVINQLAIQGEEIDMMDVSGSWWTEIDTPEDLVEAKKRIFSAAREPS